MVDDELDNRPERDTTEQNHQTAAALDPHLSPREIQQRIRSGESVESVAHAAGTTVEYAARFAAPILDELEHMLNHALDTPVITAEHSGEDEPVSFGQVIGMRLELIFNAKPDWSIWKDLLANRWIVQLRFVSDEISHDARWWYEPKRQYLSPLNPDAENLSSVSPHHPSRLRVYSQEETAANVTRFDSAAFRPDPSQEDTLPHNEPIVYGRSQDAVITELYHRNPPVTADETAETEELLDELQRQRGERNDSQPFFTLAEYETIDIPLDDFDEDPFVETESEPPVEKPQPPANETQRNTGSHGRRGRQQVPSWDEIVFGAKPEEF